MAFEKDQLIQQCHKLEFRLKQAQVILNLGEQESSKSKTRQSEDEAKSAFKNMGTGASGTRGSPRHMQTPNTYKGGAYNGMYHGQSVMISDLQGEQL